MLADNCASLAIALYVPDTIASALGENAVVERLICSGVPELDFLPPPWWEQSHTVRLGPLQAGDATAKRGNAPSSHPGALDG